MPAAVAYSSVARCVVEPTPVEANGSDPGFSFAMAANSCAVLAGWSARTTSDGGVAHHQRDRREIAQRVVGQVVAHVRRDRDRADGGEEDGVAVGLRLGDEVGADRAVGAGLVLDQHRLRQRVLQLVGEQPADEIGRAAGREGDHHADRAGGEVLGWCGGRDRGRKKCGGSNGKACEHGIPPRRASCVRAASAVRSDTASRARAS